MAHRDFLAVIQQQHMINTGSCSSKTTQTECINHAH